MDFLKNYNFYWRMDPALPTQAYSTLNERSRIALSKSVCGNLITWGIWSIKRQKHAKFGKNHEKWTKMSFRWLRTQILPIESSFHKRIRVELSKSFHLRYYMPMKVVQGRCANKNYNFLEYSFKMAAQRQGQTRSSPKIFQKSNFKAFRIQWQPICMNEIDFGHLKIAIKKGLK